eukprot:CAMPEP_0204854504 /NCGR_PEP_ID=MMETSP1347-20130617/15205_1 /ASSEMBLY_ACC=CAM_ASM_000690 /TAXON_ID=215587 /ORGANISM="Aplanochytrium stocchinoi, Strain GSBS06" /LENGTH=193 /DNA_ID=CAMNT_0052000091 /DNA_START=310 /DNA_END=891 /DNA_ORIENTATION=-
MKNKNASLQPARNMDFETGIISVQSNNSSSDGLLTRFGNAFSLHHGHSHRFYNNENLESGRRDKHMMVVERYYNVMKEKISQRKQVFQAKNKIQANFLKLESAYKAHRVSLYKLLKRTFEKLDEKERIRELSEEEMRLVCVLPCSCKLCGSSEKETAKSADDLIVNYNLLYRLSKKARRSKQKIDTYRYFKYN